MRDKAKGVGGMSIVDGGLPECEVKILMTPYHTPPSMCAALGRVEPELVGLPRKAVALDATRRPRFIVHAAGWLHSMVIHGQELLYTLFSTFTILLLHHNAHKPSETICPCFVTVALYVCFLYLELIVVYYSQNSSRSF